MEIENWNKESNVSDKCWLIPLPFFFVNIQLKMAMLIEAKHCLL